MIGFLKKGYAKLKEYTKKIEDKIFFLIDIWLDSYKYLKWYEQKTEKWNKKLKEQQKKLLLETTDEELNKMTKQQLKKKVKQLVVKQKEMNTWMENYFYKLRKNVKVSLFAILITMFTATSFSAMAIEYDPLRLFQGLLHSVSIGILVGVFATLIYKFFMKADKDPVFIKLQLIELELAEMKKERKHMKKLLGQFKSSLR